MNTTSETPWQFPCDFPIKIVGLANAEFEVFALGVIHKHFPQLTEGALQLRPSKDGKYLAITVTVLADSKEQLDAVYQELTANKLVIMAL